MKKLKGLYKKNKIMFILTTIAAACILVVLLVILSSFIGKGAASKYGDRLEGIEDVKISSSSKKDLVESIEEEDTVEKVSIDIKGKIIYINIDVDKETSYNTVKEIANKSLKEFDDDELDFYDIQYIVTCSKDEKSKNYPTMGYKNNTSSKIVWINKTA